MSETAPQTKSRLQAVRAAIESGRLRPIKRMLLSLQPAEIALLLDSLPPAERELLWETVDPDDEGEVLLHVAEEVRAGLIRGMDDEELVAAAGAMDVDDLADLIGDLPETVTQRVLRSLDEHDRGRLQRVLTYPEDTAGSLMNTDAVTVRPEVTLEVVRRYLRMRGDVPDKTDCLFVVNRYGKYLGALFVTRLLTNEDDLTVGEVMETEPAGIPAERPAVEVARLFANRDLVSAAVVDGDGRVVGRITVDDVVDVISEQAEHSIMSMAGLDEEDDIFAPVAASARRRALWLGINLATAFLAAWVVGLFESTIERVVALAVLMPIVASMGGIAGHADAHPDRARARARSDRMVQRAANPHQRDRGRNSQRPRVGFRRGRHRVPVVPRLAHRHHHRRRDDDEPAGSRALRRGHSAAHEAPRYRSCARRRRRAHHRYRLRGLHDAARSRDDFPQVSQRTRRDGAVSKGTGAPDRNAYRLLRCAIASA
jgi:magnesium transporter